MRLTNQDEFDLASQPGDFVFLNNNALLMIRLTVDEDGVCVLPIRCPLCPVIEDRVQWNWDGDLYNPTLTPSILHHSKIPWHGFMRNGKLETV